MIKNSPVGELPWEKGVEEMKKNKAFLAVAKRLADK